jgi:beta-N-acetylglucosaminidase
MSSASNTLTSTFWGNQQNLWGDTFSRSTPSIYNPTSSSTTSNTQHSSSNSSSSGSRVKTWNKMTNSEMLATYGNYTRSITDKYKGTEADLNKYLADKGVLKGKAKAFLAAQEKYNINAAVLVAICVHETKLGTSSLAINKNNVGGIRISGSNSFQAFPTIEKCIDTMGSILRNGYADQGLTKLYQVNAKYCPATDPTDKKGTNGIWAKKVNEYLDNIEKVRA